MTLPFTGMDQELFRRVTQTLDGTTTQTVGNIAVSLLVHAICQATNSRKNAEELMDLLAARAKGVLLSNYDPVTGKKRLVNAPTHVLEVPLHVEGSRSI